MSKNKSTQKVVRSPRRYLAVSKQPFFAFLSPYAPFGRVVGLGLTHGPKFGGEIIVGGQQEYRWQQTPTQVVSSAPTGMHGAGVGRGW